MKRFPLSTTLSMSLVDCETANDLASRSLVLGMQHRRSKPPHPSNLGKATTRIFLWRAADIWNYDLLCMLVDKSSFRRQPVVQVTVGSVSMFGFAFLSIWMCGLNLIAK